MSGTSTSGTNGTIIVSGPHVLQVSDFYVKAGVLHPLAVGSIAVVVSSLFPSEDLLELPLSLQFSLTHYAFPTHTSENFADSRNCRFYLATCE